jgi:ABC-type transport system involved in multi-copper enzyme maturation permease subunit
MVLECFSTCGSLAETTISKFTNMDENINHNNTGSNNTCSNNTSSNNTGSNNTSSNNTGSNNIKLNIMNPKNMNGIDLIVVIITLVICTLPAVVIATKCNPKTPVLMGIIAFLFDRIYLFQHVVRKYILREKNYCKNIYCK